MKHLLMVAASLLLGLTAWSYPDRALSSTFTDKEMLRGSL